MIKKAILDKKVNSRNTILGRINEVGKARRNGLGELNNQPGKSDGEDDIIQNTVPL